MIISVASRLRPELASIPITAWAGILVIGVIGVCAILAPAISPYSETAIVGDAFETWSREHWLGTDNLGRDMLSRLIFGARNTVGLALATTLLAFAIGLSTGLSAAVVGGYLDLLLGRAVDVLMAIPQLIFALLILAVVGPSAVSMICVVAVLESTRIFRLARAVGMSIVAMDFVDVARLRGESLGSIVFREVLPNAAAPLVAEFGLRFCFVFLFVSALSFLGLGLQPPAADWGSMVHDNASLITFGDITPLIPAAAIAILTIGVNFVVDWYLSISSRTAH